VGIGLGLTFGLLDHAPELLSISYVSLETLPSRLIEQSMSESIVGNGDRVILGSGRKRLVGLRIR
jgi:hypothetical protein